MNPVLVGLVVGLGSALGIWIEFPHARAEGLAIFGAFNAVMGFTVAAVLFLAADVFKESFRR